MFERHKKQRAFKREQKKGKRRAEEAEKLRRKGVDVCIAHKWRPAVAIIFNPQGYLVPLCGSCYHEHNQAYRYR